MPTPKPALEGLSRLVCEVRVLANELENEGRFQTCQGLDYDELRFTALAMAQNLLLKQTEACALACAQLDVREQILALKCCFVLKNTYDWRSSPLLTYRPFPLSLLRPLKQKTPQTKTPPEQTTSKSNSSAAVDASMKPVGRSRCLCTRKTKAATYIHVGTPH